MHGNRGKIIVYLNKLNRLLLLTEKYISIKHLYFLNIEIWEKLCERSRNSNLLRKGLIKSKVWAPIENQTYRKYSNQALYVYIYIYIYIYIYANFIKHNRHFMPTYFLLDPFEFPYYFYRIRGGIDLGIDHSCMYP